MQAAVTAWIYAKTSQPSSCEKYLAVLRSFCAHTKILRFDRLLSVSSLFLGDYSEHLALSMSPRSVVTNMQILRGFFTYLHDEGLLLRSPFKPTHLPKVDRRRLYHENRVGHVRRALTIEQGQAILDWSTAQSPAKATALALLLCLGLRRAEVVGLQRSDAYSEAGQRHLSVQGKGKRTRTLWVDAVAAAALDRVLPTLRGRGPLLRKSDGSAYRPATVGAWVREAGEVIGRPDLTPHELRRTHATLIRDAGATLTEAQLQLGHASPITTQEIYDQGDRRYKGPSGFRVPA